MAQFIPKWEEYGNSNAKLVVHAGGYHIQRDQLVNLTPKVCRPGYKPVAHYDLIEAISSEVSNRGIHISLEELAYNPKKDMLVGIMVLDWVHNDQFAACLAFRHSNDGTEAIKLYAGVRVFACDNTSVSGQEIILCKKHTKHLNVGSHMPDAFDRYQAGTLALTKSIEELENEKVSTSKGRELIYDIFRKKVVPMRYFHQICEQWEDVDTPDNMWSLHNCCTNPIKDMKPQPFLACQHRLGRFFKLGKVHTGQKTLQNGLGQEILENEALEAEFEAIP